MLIFRDLRKLQQNNKGDDDDDDDQKKCVKNQ